MLKLKHFFRSFLRALATVGWWFFASSILIPGFFAFLVVFIPCLGLKTVLQLVEVLAVGAIWVLEQILGLSALLYVWLEDRVFGA
jgi:hypothetical protein